MSVWLSIEKTLTLSSGQIRVQSQLYKHRSNLYGGCSSVFIPDPGNKFTHSVLGYLHC